MLKGKCSENQRATMSVADRKSGVLRGVEYSLDLQPSDPWFLFSWGTGDRQQLAKSKEVTEWIIGRKCIWHEHVSACTGQKELMKRKLKNKELEDVISHHWGGRKGYVLERRQCRKLKQQFVYLIKFFC